MCTSELWKEGNINIKVQLYCIVMLVKAYYVMVGRLPIGVGESTTPPPNEMDFALQLAVLTQSSIFAKKLIRHIRQK